MIPYVELYYGTYEVYRVEISKQTYKGVLNRFLYYRYICESQAFTDISVKKELHWMSAPLQLCFEIISGYVS